MSFNFKKIIFTDLPDNRAVDVGSVVGIVAHVGMRLDDGPVGDSVGCHVALPNGRVGLKYLKNIKFFSL